MYFHRNTVLRIQSSKCSVYRKEKLLERSYAGSSWITRRTDPLNQPDSLPENVITSLLPTWYSLNSNLGELQCRDLSALVCQTQRTNGAGAREKIGVKMRAGPRIISLVYFGVWPQILYCTLLIQLFSLKSTELFSWLYYAKQSTMRYNHGVTLLQQLEPGMRAFKGE